MISVFDKCEPTKEGATITLKVPHDGKEDFYEHIMMQCAPLMKKEVETFRAGRIVTLDEQASEKFAALFTGIDEVMARFRTVPVHPSDKNLLDVCGDHPESAA